MDLDEPEQATGCPKYVWMIRYFHAKQQYLDPIYKSCADCKMKIRCLRELEHFEEHLEIVKPTLLFSEPFIVLLIY